MNQIQKKNNEYAFKLIKGAFDNLTMPETKKYYLTLGNYNEVHMIRKDAKKSVFLGRLAVNTQDDLKPQMQAVWDVLRSYFLDNPEPVDKPATEVSGMPTVKLDDFSNDARGKEAPSKPEPVAEKPATTQKKATKKTSKAESKEEPKAPALEPLYDDGSSIDPEAEEAFDKWVDRIGE